MTWMILASVFAFLAGEEVEVELNAAEFSQGETIRLEVRRMTEECSLAFNEVAHSLYQVDSLHVCLIGIPADFPAGSCELELSGKSAKWKGTITVKPASYPREEIVFPPEKAPLLDLDISEERKIIREALRKESDARFWDAVFVIPVDGRITSPYGARRNGGYHRGVDISAKRGTIVRTPAGGRVTVAKNFPIHGKTVVLEHGQGISTVYCHLDTIFVEEGELLKKASPLGKAGNTGRTTAPHLHWGLYVHGVSVDPSLWLVREY